MTWRVGMMGSFEKRKNVKERENNDNPLRCLLGQMESWMDEWLFTYEITTLSIYLILIIYKRRRAQILLLGEGSKIIRQRET